MEEILVRALESTGLEVFNIERPEMVKNCIVYNYSESNQSYIDDEVDIKGFTIYVNLYCDSGLNKRRDLINIAMKSEGFGLNYIAPAYKSRELGVIQQSFTFNYCEQNSRKR